MKFTRKNLLGLFIFGIMLIGGYKLLNFDAHTDEYTTVPQTVEVLADQVSPAAKNWIVIGENALPNIPCRIYVLKTASRAEIWHMSAITRSENGKITSVTGPKLSEKQKLNLLNTGVAPKGWEVVYVDQVGNPIYSDKQEMLTPP